MKQTAAAPVEKARGAFAEVDPVGDQFRFPPSSPVRGGFLCSKNRSGSEPPSTISASEMNKKE